VGSGEGPDHKGAIGVGHLISASLIRLSERYRVIRESDERGLSLSNTRDVISLSIKYITHDLH